jgi:tRNA (cmo5U34)-methyltransferase
MPSDRPSGGLSRPHDWHSTEYVADWIARDEARDPVRRPRLREMIEVLPYPREARLAVLDVGAGFGAVTEELLRVFPNAEVTLQDYSEPMLAEAKRRLAGKAEQMRYIAADLTNPGWPTAVGGSVDLAISAICLHNLGDDPKIFACYRAIYGLLKPGGWFLDYDLFFRGVDSHLAAMSDSGFVPVECRWQDGRHAIVAAMRAH